MTKYTCKVVRLYFVGIFVMCYENAELNREFHVHFLTFLLLFFFSSHVFLPDRVLEQPRTVWLAHETGWVIYLLLLFFFFFSSFALLSALSLTLSDLLLLFNKHHYLFCIMQFLYPPGNLVLKCWDSISCWIRLLFLFNFCVRSVREVILFCSMINIVLACV